MNLYRHAAQSRSIHNKRGVDSSSCNLAQDEVCGMMET